MVKYKNGDFVKFKDSFEGTGTHTAFNEYRGTTHEISLQHTDGEEGFGEDTYDFVADGYWWPNSCIGEILKREEHPEFLL